MGIVKKGEAYEESPALIVKNGTNSVSDIPTCGLLNLIIYFTCRFNLLLVYPIAD